MTTSNPQPTRGENRITIAVMEEQISAAPGNGVNVLRSVHVNLCRGGYYAGCH